MSRGRPVVLYVSSGWIYLIYTIWSIRSLQRFGYDPIELVVSKEVERRFAASRLPDVSCKVVRVPHDGYHDWMWKVFVLDRYEVKHAGRDVVVSDGDILWHQDPSPLFERFAGQFWFHKINEIDPREFELPSHEIPRDKSNWLDLASFAYYRERYGLLQQPRHLLTGGLFMVPADDYRQLIARWASAGLGLPPEQARRNSVLLTIVADELGLEPVRDREAGYAVAKHYLSDMKPQLVRDATQLGLDHEHLSRPVAAWLRLRSFWKRGLWEAKAIASRMGRLARQRA